MQDQPPAKRVIRCALTGSEETVEFGGVSSSAPVVSGGAVAAERSPPVCEGELCGVSSSLRLGWNRPCLELCCPPSRLSSVECMHVTLNTHVCESGGHQKRCSW